MPYDIYLPPEIFSHIEGASGVNRVNNLEVLNNSIKVGNYYIPISRILFIKEIS